MKSSFRILNEEFEINENGKIIKILNNKTIEMPIYEIINDRLYAIFSNRKIFVANRFLKEFLNLDVGIKEIGYKDSDQKNISTKNILIKGSNILNLNSNYREVENAIKYRIENSKKLTLYEKIFKDICIELNILFESQKVFFNDNSFYILDFYFPKYKVAVEIDGSHHCNDLRQYFYDIKRTDYLKEKYNVNTIRIPNLFLKYKNSRSEIKKNIKHLILKNKHNIEKEYISAFISNKINVYKLFLDCFIEFSLNNNVQIKSNKFDFLKKFEDRIYFNDIEFRFKKLIRTISFGILRNESCYWKIKELTETCNKIGVVDELYYSNRKTASILLYIQKHFYRIVDIKFSNKRLSKGTIVYFKLIN